MRVPGSPRNLAEAALSAHGARGASARLCVPRAHSSVGQSACLTSTMSAVRARLRPPKVTERKPAPTQTPDSRSTQDSQSSHAVRRCVESTVKECVHRLNHGDCTQGDPLLERSTSNKVERFAAASEATSMVVIAPVHREHGVGAGLGRHCGALTPASLRARGGRSRWSRASRVAGWFLAERG